MTQDPDVLDTWFSSALWPFATLGWPDKTADLKAFYPTDVNCTAREIINLWVSRMIMTGLEFMGEAPFSDVVIHCQVQAAEPGSERGGNPPTRFPKYTIECGAVHPGPRTGRISIDPSCRTGTFFATAIAASRSGTSIR